MTTLIPDGWGSDNAVKTLHFPDTIDYDDNKNDYDYDDSSIDDDKREEEFTSG